jgi:hypothetical protein
MVHFYAENDGRADDFGRLFIVVDAELALAELAKDELVRGMN